MKTKKGIAIIFALCLPVLFSGCGLKKAKPDTSGGIYRSEDSALKFEQKAALKGGGTLGNANILALTMDPKNSKLIYIGTPSGIYRSDDRGDNWIKDTSNFKNVRDIEINPSNTNEIYVPAIVNGVGKIMKTENGGEQWKEVFTQRTQEGSVFTIAMNPRKPNELFAGDSGGALYKHRMLVPHGRLSFGRKVVSI